MMEAYRKLSRRPQPAATSVLVSPSTVAYTGIRGAFERREWFVAAAAVITILASFTPILLSAVPFSPSQTLTTHLVCVWMTVGCLSLMILTLLYGACFVRHPNMPMDPCTLAGRIYYVCDSIMTDDFEGLLQSREQDYHQRMDQRYFYGTAVGLSGRERTMVDHKEPDVNKESIG